MLPIINSHQLIIGLILFVTLPSPSNSRAGGRVPTSPPSFSPTDEQITTSVTLMTPATEATSMTAPISSEATLTTATSTYTSTTANAATDTILTSTLRYNTPQITPTVTPTSIPVRTTETTSITAPITSYTTLTTSTSTTTTTTDTISTSTLRYNTPHNTDKLTASTSSITAASSTTKAKQNEGRVNEDIKTTYINNDESKGDNEDTSQQKDGDILYVIIGCVSVTILCCVVCVCIRIRMIKKAVKQTKNNMSDTIEDDVEPLQQKQQKTNDAVDLQIALTDKQYNNNLIVLDHEVRSNLIAHSFGHEAAMLMNDVIDVINDVNSKHYEEGDQATAGPELNKLKHGELSVPIMDYDEGGNRIINSAQTADADGYHQVNEDDDEDDEDEDDVPPPPKAPIDNDIPQTTGGMVTTDDGEEEDDIEVPPPPMPPSVHDNDDEVLMTTGGDQVNSDEEDVPSPPPPPV